MVARFSISSHPSYQINLSEKFAVKSAKFFIGSVKNNHDGIATSRWNEKVKEAKQCGIVAMVIGVSMAIVAAVLIAGFSFLLIPTAVFMAFGVAAFLYGAVLTVIGCIGENEEKPLTMEEMQRHLDSYNNLDDAVLPKLRSWQLHDKYGYEDLLLDARKNELGIKNSTQVRCDFGDLKSVDLIQSIQDGEYFRTELIDDLA